MVGRTDEERREIEEATRPYRKKLSDNPEWREYARCKIDGKDVNFFFPNGDGHSGEVCDEIRNYCDKCWVQEECLAYALLLNEKHGWWGGKSTPQRKSIRSEENLPPFPVRNCIICGGMFYPNNIKQKVCSDECSDQRDKLRRLRNKQDSDWMEVFLRRTETGKKIGPKKAGPA